ncbi:MAG TPA: SprT-like domain-containing protein [Gemmatimonadales bacterium]|nr:SprT-like domain-containing protein [Gemmatimonadales bacterium]
MLVSLTTRGALRVHRGYAMAPDDVVRAIAQWAEPRTPRAARRRAQRVLTAFPVHAHVPPAGEARRLREPPRPGDQRTLGRLLTLYDQLNARHFGGGLGAVTLGLSGRMRRKLGEFRPAEAPGAPHEITLSRRHLRRDGWSALTETLAHEMVHQWQVETGRRLGHDAAFRARCAAMGIDPRAVRRLDDLRRSA